MSKRFISMPIEDNISLQNCSEDDVLAFDSGDFTFKLSKIKQALKSAFRSQVADSLIHSLASLGIGGLRIPTGGGTTANGNWFSEGKDCEILKIGAKGWQKGKVRLRVSLEFCPDEPDVEKTPTSNQLKISQPESPLDDIRRMINQETQPKNQ
jgi:hypothetical protein